MTAKKASRSKKTRKVARSKKLGKVKPLSLSASTVNMVNLPAVQSNPNLSNISFEKW